MKEWTAIIIESLITFFKEVLVLGYLIKDFFHGKFTVSFIA